MLILFIGNTWCNFFLSRQRINIYDNTFYFWAMIHFIDCDFIKLVMYINISLTIWSMWINWPRSYILLFFKTHPYLIIFYSNLFYFFVNFNYFCLFVHAATKYLIIYWNMHIQFLSFNIYLYFFIFIFICIDIDLKNTQIKNKFRSVSWDSLKINTN